MFAGIALSFLSPEVTISHILILFLQAKHDNLSRNSEVFLVNVILNHSLYN